MKNKSFLFLTMFLGFCSVILLTNRTLPLPDWTAALCMLLAVASLVAHFIFFVKDKESS
ncbi:hypothetical protein [Neptunitalea chrysea]|uniref:hypothetical protein n=1 Tax=Neptunitalea chrysea TaxID=1647581 RepID=UPI002491F5F3|nr:hypothetical protein [Neptunitalea chrysea]